MRMTLPVEIAVISFSVLATLGRLEGILRRLTRNRGAGRGESFDSLESLLF